MHGGFRVQPVRDRKERHGLALLACLPPVKALALPRVTDASQQCKPSDSFRQLSLFGLVFVQGTPDLAISEDGAGNAGVTLFVSEGMEFEGFDQVFHSPVVVE